MAKDSKSKNLKYKKMKSKYKNVIQTLVEYNNKLKDKLKEMEEYYMFKINFYKGKHDEEIQLVKEDNDTVNEKYLELLKERITRSETLQ